MLLPADISGNKNAVQAFGSSTSYGKRYVLSALLNITRGQDDNGKPSTKAASS
ncbi:ERF family protein [Halomonas sp. PA16-9]|uniref:ERF family protein n=1 Tax=Halomonas sp. PA16-9 TaxID=2576841 RepID=UPI0030ECE817